MFSGAHADLLKLTPIDARTLIRIVWGSVFRSRVGWHLLLVGSSAAVGMATAQHYAKIDLFGYTSSVVQPCNFPNNYNQYHPGTILCQEQNHTASHPVQFVFIPVRVLLALFLLVANGVSYCGFIAFVGVSGAIWMPTRAFLGSLILWVVVTSTFFFIAWATDYVVYLSIASSTFDMLGERGDILGLNGLWAGVFHSAFSVLDAGVSMSVDLLSLHTDIALYSLRPLFYGFTGMLLHLVLIWGGLRLGERALTSAGTLSPIQTSLTFIQHCKYWVWRLRWLVSIRFPKATWLNISLLTVYAGILFLACLPAWVYFELSRARELFLIAGMVLLVQLAVGLWSVGFVMRVYRRVQARLESGSTSLRRTRLVRIWWLCVRSLLLFQLLLVPLKMGVGYGMSHYFHRTGPYPFYIREPSATEYIYGSFTNQFFYFSEALNWVSYEAYTACVQSQRTGGYIDYASCRSRVYPSPMQVVRTTLLLGGLALAITAVLCSLSSFCFAVASHVRVASSLAWVLYATMIIFGILVLLNMKRITGTATDFPIGGIYFPPTLDFTRITYTRVTEGIANIAFTFADGGIMLGANMMRVAGRTLTHYRMINYALLNILLLFALANLLLWMATRQYRPRLRSRKHL